MRGAVGEADWEGEKIGEYGKQHDQQQTRIHRYRRHPSRRKPRSNYIIRKIVGKVNGYQISITSSSETKVMYFTGDTVLYPDLTKNVPQNIDAIFANLGAVKSGSFGGPFTMDLKMLNRMKDLLQPKRIYPIHIDDYSHYKTTKKEVEAAGYKVLAVGETIDI